MDEKKLQVKNLQVSFRTQGGILKAVRNISFDLYKGETLAIVGESGSGKSVTSKAIIGILAGNSIVEGGEILYDGKDLLKIDEENFHKIRGDKISMIFQDPLSSLNPIMRVGKQLTEAMILNGRARQKNSRYEFNTHLSLLKKNLNLLNGDTKNNEEQCKTFDNFCIESTHLEAAYNKANSNAVSLRTAVNEIVFLLEHRQKVEVKANLKKFKKALDGCVHPYVVTNDKQLEELKASLEETLSHKEFAPEQVVVKFKAIVALLDEALKKEHPNFFRLGYYKYRNPDFDIASMSVKELDQMTLDYLNNEFMNSFIELGSSGIKYAFEQSQKLKRESAECLKSFREQLAKMDKFEAKEIKPLLAQTVTKVKNSIDYLSIEKNSAEYSYNISIKHEFKRYYYGVRHNPINQRRYERMKAKHEALIAKGKNPTWQVIPPYLVDLELTKSNIFKIIDDLIALYEKGFEEESKFDETKEMVEMIDFFKEQASRLVYRVTPGIAKTRALELLKEVGISEPEIRYKQYPFELSGGMRQRIVIAIALSANPDILICDEPTTALDVTIQSQILELINKIKAERNLSVIFITHDLGVVANMADRIAVMYAGKIVEYGTSEDVFYDPRHPYTWALLASMPDLETKEKLEAIPGTPPNMIYPPKGDAFAERNKYALEIDYEMDPPLFEVSETHFAATWLLHPNAPKVEPPKIIKERILRMKKEAEEL